MSEATEDSAASLRAEIDRTRADLSDTVAALAAKTDVKARAADAVAGAKTQVKSAVSDAKSQVKATVSSVADDVVEAGHAAGGQLNAGVAAVGRRAVPVALIGAAIGAVVAWLIWRRR